MKKKQFAGKLTLNKETISTLQNDQMARIVGGTDNLCGESKYGKCSIVVETVMRATCVNCCTNCNCG